MNYLCACGTIRDNKTHLKTSEVTKDYDNRNFHLSISRKVSVGPVVKLPCFQGEMMVKEDTIKLEKKNNLKKKQIKKTPKN